MKAEVKKAQLKNKEETVEVLPEGIKIKDLTVEKRIELFIKSYQEFEKKGIETFGCKLGVEQNYLPQAIVPKLVVIDLLKKDETKNPIQEAPKA